MKFHLCHILTQKTAAKKVAKDKVATKSNTKRKKWGNRVVKKSKRGIANNAELMWRNLPLGILYLEIN